MRTFVDLLHGILQLPDLPADTLSSLCKILVNVMKMRTRFADAYLTADVLGDLMLINGRGRGRSRGRAAGTSSCLAQAIVALPNQEDCERPYSICESALARQSVPVVSIEGSNQTCTTFLRKIAQFAARGLQSLSLREMPLHSDASFVAFDQWLCAVPALLCLDLSSTRIGDGPCTSLALALRHLPQLTALYLRSNDIGASGFTALVHSFRCVSNLRTLDLSSNIIGADGCASLTASSFRSVASLTSLSVHGNRIGDEGVRSIARALKGAFQLTHLDVSSNDFGVEGCRALSPALQELPQLVDLDISCNSIGADGCISFALSLPALRELRALNMSHCHIGWEGGEAIARGLVNATNLTVLGVSNCSLADVGIAALAGRLPTLSSLKKFDVSQNGAGAAGTAALVATLPELRQLTSLSLGVSDLLEQNAPLLDVLLDVLSQLPCLETLDGASIPSTSSQTTLHLDRSCSGASAFALAALRPMTIALRIRRSPHLTDVSVCNCATELAAPTACDVIASGLRGLRALTNLNFSRNHLGPAELRPFVAVLPSLNQLTSLNFSRNRLGEAGARELAQSFRSLAHLQQLDVSFNMLGDDGIRVLAESLCHLRALQMLNVLCNGCGDQGRSAVTAAAASLPYLRDFNPGPPSKGYMLVFGTTSIHSIQNAFVVRALCACSLARNVPSHDSHFDPLAPPTSAAPGFDYGCTVKRLIGRTLDLNVDPSDTVEMLKWKIEVHASIPAADQRLIFGGQALEDSRTLEDYHIQKECTINTVLRLRGD